MAPTFLNNLRRRSRASFRTNRSTDTSSDGATSQATSPSSGSLTPPSIDHQSDPALHLQVKDQQQLQRRQSQMSQSQSQLNVPTRPPLSSNSNRNSVSGMSGLGAPSINGRQTLPVSPYAPRVINITENAWVCLGVLLLNCFYGWWALWRACRCKPYRQGLINWYQSYAKTSIQHDSLKNYLECCANRHQVYQKVLLVYGTIGNAAENPLDGTLNVCRLDDNFPAISWPVCNSHFKALVYLQPGPNRLRFEFSSPKLANSNSSNPIHASYLTVHMLPVTNSPPLQLAILVAKDSPETFDASPARVEKEGNGLEMAVKKFRMAAYLWQAFTSEQMWRNKLGRRAFRFDEEWTTGSANYRDQENGTMRSEARVHIIRSDKTLAEIRDLNKAQQNEKATDKGALYGIASEAVRKYFNPLPGQKLYVSCLLLDSHWDTAAKTVTGHAALGGGDGDLQLAIFGSHCLHSYPSTFEEVVPAFTDCTPTDTNHVANDCNEAGSSWEAANIGIGAHMHETGHLFGCPHQESGVMLRDYVVLNRTFVAREAYCTRTKSKGGLALQADECGWHRLDCLRFRAHPSFRLPNDPPMSPDGSVQAFPLENGNVLVMAATGIFFVEIYADGDDVCHAWIEYPTDQGTPSRQITLTESELRGRLPEKKRKGSLKISVKSYGGGSLEIDDYKKFTSKESLIKLLNGKSAFRSQKLGSSKMDGSQPTEAIFTSAVKQDRVLSRVVIYHGMAVDGMEFIYDDDSRQLFGKKGGKEGGDTFEFGKF